MEGVTDILNQDFPSTKEWNEFLMNLVDSIKSGRIRDKAVIVNQGLSVFI